MADLPSSPPSQKVSRYRSQRKPHPPPDELRDPLPVQQHEVPADDSFTRSKSRYRRGPTGASRPATARDQDHVDVVPRPASKRVASAERTAQTQMNSRPPSQRQPGGLKTYHERTVSPPTQSGTVDTRRVNGGELDWDEEDGRRKRLQERYSAQQGQVAGLVARKRSSPPTGELFPPPQPTAVRPTTQPVVLDGPPTSDQIRATKSTSALPQFKDDEDEETAGCFGLFKRKRGEVAPQNEKHTLSHPVPSNEPATIKPGGGGVVPGIDAPVSAVNSGDRSVLVECGKSKTVFPVTPTTTPVDIIKTASVCMAERIDLKSAVLIESFITVGIQRPLRRYEHIRDVMNSWDTDRSNALILVDPGTGSSEVELSVAGAPKQKPEDHSWFMSFSQKPGKWDKRYISLRSDGQIVAQKDPDKPKDVVNVCHLSDFDIYTPTQEKARRKIKPPKKMCFAIKSQQKSSVFESTQNFVHFFCTNDRQTADDFHATIQGWRSWYLVHVMGEGRKPKSAEGAAMDKEIGRGNTHRTGNSMDSAYHLGSFKPLIEMDQLDRRPGTGRSAEAPPPMSAGFTKSSSQFDTTVSPERRTSRAKKQRPPGAMGNRGHLAEDEPLANLGTRPSTNRRRPSNDQTKASPEEFLTTGLLGRTYSQRQRENAERENKKESPFTNGSNLLNTGYDVREEEYSGRRSSDLTPKRTHSTRAQHAHGATDSGGIHRSNSRAREMPKPLVDLTPQYREPPQHLKKGRGYNPDGGAGALIENATSPEDPLGLPPSTDWRARNNASGSPQSRSPPLSRNQTVSRSIRRPAADQSAFTGEGLMAGPQAQSGWGGGTKGRGVMDGSRAKGPMVDLTQRNQFANGSLLGKVERAAGQPQPVIDRSRED
ncbi:uncharacterized protein LTR77_011088 [Saxophila tyrrhenica]|uniref:PH domain-containing protein n=1 Tax=Saxophila tyrrhenica TaxID=1690608 RepID=A0AAV9NXK5_9PEZI|nr:hypothetical protein LTR77_011088 [Saxophila tyrrhenica]